MPSELPYLPTYKNVGKLFSTIATAKVPDVFTHKVLSETMGIGASSDRPLIPLLRVLGFLDSANRSTAEYAALKNPALARQAIAAAIRRAYAPLFAANENAHTLSGESLKGAIAQVAGTDEGTTQKIAGTFRALVSQADFSGVPAQIAPAEGGKQTPPVAPPPAVSGLRPEFHYNIQVHLPANGTEETYLSIFNALRKAFQ